MAERQRRYAEHKKKDALRKKLSTEKQRSSCGATIRGKKTGTLTLARRRELRDKLERQDEGYEDDAFEGTPFRNKKTVLKYKVSPVILSDTAEDDTPSTSKTQRYHPLRPAGPLTDSSASESDTMSDGLLNSVNRNDIDRYVNQLIRRKYFLGCKLTQSTVPTAQMKSDKPDPVAINLENEFTKYENCDDESDQDYYWSSDVEDD